MKTAFITLFAFAAVTAGAQNFTVIDSLPVGAYGTAAWGDFDGDGRKDLAYITQTVTVGQPDIFNVYHNTGSGLVAVPHVFTHLFNAGVCWGDLDNDGKEDLVASGMLNTNLESVTQLFQSNGNGAFTFRDTLVGLSNSSVAIADYDNDGWKDIALCGMDHFGVPRAFIYHNEGNFTFRDIKAGLQGAHAGEAKWCDYDKDGKMDLAINGFADALSRTRIYHNDGAGSFSELGIYMKGGAGTLDWIDYDGDGFQDLLTAGVDSTSVRNFTDLYKNNAGSSFTLQTSFNAPSFGEPVATDVADFNGDGKTDICFAGGNDSFSDLSALALGSGSPVFGFLPFKRIDIQNCIVAAADIDNDGDQDLLFSNLILRNDGTTGIGDLHQAISSVYPNPVSKVLFIESQVEGATVILFDMSGKQLQKRTLQAGKNSLDVSCYPAGNYVLLLQQGRSYQSKPVVIRH